MSVGVLRVKPTYANIHRPEKFDTGLRIRVLDQTRHHCVLRIACPILGHMNERSNLRTDYIKKVINP